MCCGLIRFALLLFIRSPLIILIILIILIHVIIARTCIVRSIYALRRESGTTNGVDGC